MTSPKHSPGPWKMNVARSPASILDANSDCIAKVFLTDAVTKRRDQTHVANANLIAAAPELLAVLRLILRESDRLTEAEFQAAAGAISNAEGRL